MPVLRHSQNPLQGPGLAFPPDLSAFLILNRTGVLFSPLILWGPLEYPALHSLTLTHLQHIPPHTSWCSDFGQYSSLPTSWHPLSLSKSLIPPLVPCPGKQGQMFFFHSEMTVQCYVANPSVRTHTCKAHPKTSCCTKGTAEMLHLTKNVTETFLTRQWFYRDTTYNTLNKRDSHPDRALETKSVLLMPNCVNIRNLLPHLSLYSYSSIRWLSRGYFCTRVSGHSKLLYLSGYH